MKVLPSLLAVSVSLAISFTSCKKENVSNPNEPTAVMFQLRATNTTSVLNRTTAGSLVWTSGRAEANQIKFEAKKGGIETEFKSNVQRSIDLFATTSDIGNVNIPVGSYDEVEFKAFLAPASGNPSIELRGTFTTNAAPVPVMFRSTEAIQIKGEKHNVVIQDAAGYNAITAVNLALAASGISATTLSNATKTNGEILITSSVNANIYTVLVENLRNMHEETEFHHH